jgi:hypothetical protein
MKDQSKPTTKPKPIRKGQRKPSLDLVKQNPSNVIEELREIEDQIRSHIFAEIEHDSTKIEKLMSGLEAMRQSLTSDQRSSVESIAIEQVVTAWTQSTVSAMRLQEIQPPHRTAYEGSFWERRHHLAQGRLLRALEFLERVRRTNLPGFEPEGITIRVEYVDQPEYRRSLGAG